MTLTELFQRGGRKEYPTDKGDGHSYLPVYDKLFVRYRDQEIDVFECGHSAGGALRLFEDYFTKAKIWGIDNRGDQDIEAWGTKFRTDRVKTIMFDMRMLDEVFFIENGFWPTIAIDDSSHAIEDQLWFLEIMKEIVRPGGLVVIEDVLDAKKNFDKFLMVDKNVELYDLNPVMDTRDNALVVWKR